MKLENITKIAMFLLVVIMLAQPILALGVSPARSVIDFEPGLRKSVTLKIMNNEHKDFKAIAYIKGELADYTNIKETLTTIAQHEDFKAIAYKTIKKKEILITITQHEDYKEFTYEVILPQEMKKPGIYTSEIVILEFPKEFAAEEETVVTATASVSSELRVRVPYPGKYAEAQLHISGGDVKEGTRFVIPVFNYGKENIASAKAKIRILGATYEEIDVLETNEISIESKNEGKLVAVWKADINPGVYHAIAEITYDGKPIKLEKNFDIGSLFIDIENIKVDDFTLGDIAKFDIYLKSKWNQPIEDVYAEMTVSDKDQEIYTFKTASVDMPSSAEKKLEAYWDTKGISVGMYNVNIVLYYAGKITEELFEVQVNINSIRSTLTAEVIAPGGAIDRNTILVVLVIIMLVVNIGWLIYIKRIKKK